MVREFMSVRKMHPFPTKWNVPEAVEKPQEAKQEAETGKKKAKKDKGPKGGTRHPGMAQKKLVLD